MSAPRRERRESLSHPIPRLVRAFDRFRSLPCGGDCSCALSMLGDLVCRGMGREGQMGNGAVAETSAWPVYSGASRSAP